MAKESKSHTINPYILCAISAVLLSAALLMRSFPVLIFAAIAPLFAITDHANEGNFWNKVELVGVAFAAGLVAWSGFDTAMTMTVVLESIAIALTFLAYTFSRRGLGSRLGKLTLIIFWLATEYLLVKFFANKPVFFLADAVYAKTAWLRWTNSTGYLGASLWILVANLFFYLGLLRNGLRIWYLLVFLIVILGPIFYSYTLQTDYATRLHMLLLYMNDPTPAEGYNARGEWIPRTAAWISVLILLSAFVKDNIRKK
jgi:apolipoprotein N-acyltransferase